MIPLHMRFALAISCFFATLLHAGQPEWSWTPQELRRVALLASQTKKDGANYVVDTSVWKVTTDISTQFTAELACFLEVFEVQFLQIAQIKSEPKVSARMEAKVFAAEADYRKLFNNGSRGYFRWSCDSPETFTEFTLYSFVQRPEEKEFKKFYHPILLHEGTHMMLQRYAGINKLPVFLNEGFASYFQFWNLRKTLGENLMARKNQSFYRKLMLERLRSDKAYAPDLGKLFETADKDWNPDRMGPLANFNYAQAEAFIEALATEPALRGVLPPLLSNALNGKEAIEAKDLPRLNALWNAALRR